MQAAVFFRYYILLTAIAGIVICPARAQDKNAGHVTIHTDPRLAVLMKKNHTLPPPAMAMAAPSKTVTEVVPKPNLPVPAATNTLTPTAANAKIPVTGNKTPIIPPAANAPRPVPNIQVQPTGKTPAATAHSTFHGKGFRVQIYYGSDRAKALAIKTQFTTHFPGTRSYITYNSPNFRVRVGNYRNRTDAEGMLREANSMYSPSMIVPDEVVIESN